MLYRAQSTVSDIESPLRKTNARKTFRDASEISNSIHFHFFFSLSLFFLSLTHFGAYNLCKKE
jgi:hypothetical protein